MKYIGPNISFIFTKIKELMNSHNTDNSAHSELFKSWKRLRNPNNADIADALAATYKNGIGDVLVEVKDDTTFALEDIKLFFRPASFKLISANESNYEGIYITMDGTQGRYVAKTFADSEIMTPEGPSTISTPSELALYPAASDAVLYTPQTLTEAQQKQARDNIGALDVNIKTTPVDIDVTLFGRGENIVYVKDGWLRPCPTDADTELVKAYRRLAVQIGGQSTEPIPTAILATASGIYLLYQNGLTSANAKIMPTLLNENRYAIWTISTNNSKHYVSFSVYGVAYSHFCKYCVEDNALVDENFSRAIYSTSTGVGAQTNVKQFRMSAAPTEDMHIATKQYVDTAKTEAQQLGLTAATPGQIIKVKTVQDGKPTEWEAVSPDYTLTVTVNTQDGVTVTGQTVTVRAGDADGPVYGTAEYNGQPVSFRVADGFAYYAEVTDNLAAHFKPTTVKGVINGANAAVTLLYNDFNTIHTAPDIQAALDADMDLTELVGRQITCQRGNDTLSWDVVDYDSTTKVVTLCTHDTLPEAIQFEPPQALMYCEDGLTAGSYTFKWNNTQCYFTLTQAIPAGGQLMATNRAFQTYESMTATAQIESGTVSTEAIDGATNLGQTGTGNLNHHDRANYGSNNFGESGILQWLNSDSPANTPLPRLTKFSRPYVPTKAGFKAGLDADFLACIQDTVWKCSANNVYECPASLGGIAKKGNPYTVTAKFALASEIEVFGEYGGTQDGGTVWDLYVGAEATDRIKYYNNTARSWWLRSPYWNITNRERNVNTSGAGIYNYANHSNGVAVACKIAKSKVADIYEKPDTGIPKSDLEQSVQTSLNKADTAISYKSQTLTEEQKSQARTNIGAGQPVFVVNVTEVSEGGGHTADKTAAEIEAAYQAGCTIVCKMQALFMSSYIPVELPLVSRNQGRAFSFAVDLLVSNGIFGITVNIIDSEVEVYNNMVEIYGKPADGIPKSDLAADVQTSLDNAMQQDGGTYSNYIKAATTNGVRLLQNEMWVGSPGAGKCVNIDKNGIGIYGESGTLGLYVDASRIHNLVTPSDDADAANKQYVDAAKTEAQQLGLTTATPGKTIKVKTVQDGRPTEWEAVDIYEKPTSGIPKSDLAQSVQTSLAKADTAISYNSQTLTDAQKQQARTNIGAVKCSVSGNRLILTT